MSSSPSDRVVDVFVIGRTLRGTLGDAFLRLAIDEFERMHPAARATTTGQPPEAPFTSISRTVELTAVAVTRAGPVSIDVDIADRTFAPFTRGGASQTDYTRAAAGAGVTPGGTTARIALDTLADIRPVSAPPGIDVSRTARIDVRSPHEVVLRTHVLPEDALEHPGAID